MLGLAATRCLPPDFEIAPEVNLPVGIDRSQLINANPDELQILSECTSPRHMVLRLDPSQAVTNPDDDTIFSYWLVNYAESPEARPEQDDTRTEAPFAETFAFDACTTPEDIVGRTITITLVVRDRPPLDESTGRAVVEDDSDGVTKDTVVWFIQVESTTCCTEDVL